MLKSRFPVARPLTRLPVARVDRGDRLLLVCADARARIRSCGSPTTAARGAPPSALGGHGTGGTFGTGGTSLARAARPVQGALALAVAPAPVVRSAPVALRRRRRPRRWRRRSRNRRSGMGGMFTAFDGSVDSEAGAAARGFCNGLCAPTSIVQLFTVGPGDDGVSLAPDDHHRRMVFLDDPRLTGLEGPTAATSLGVP